MQKFKKWIRRIALFSFLLFMLLLIAYILLKTSPVQNYITKKIVAGLSENLETKIDIGKVKISFFDHAHIEDFVIYDQSNDTLASGENVNVDIGLFSILGKQFRIDDISFENGFLNLYAINDSTYNFTFLTDSSDSDTIPISNDQGWVFNLDKFDLVDFRFSFRTDDQRLSLFQKELNGNFKNFDLASNTYLLSNLSASDGNIDFNQSKSDAVSADTPFILPALPIELGADEFSFNNQNVNLSFDGNPYNFTDLNLSFEDFYWQDNNIRLDLNNGNVIIDNEYQLNTIKANLVADSLDFKLTDIFIESEHDFLSSSEIVVSPSFDGFVIKDFESEILYSTLEKIKSFLPADINLLSGVAFKSSIKSIDYSPNAFNGRGLDVVYGNNKLKGDLYMPLPSGLNGELNADIKSLELNIPQMQRLYPKLIIPDELKNIKYLKFRGVARGKLSNITINNANLELDNQVKGTFNGTVLNILEPNSLAYNLSNVNLFIDSTFISNYHMPEMALNELGSLIYRGNINGDLRSINLDGVTNTDLGVVEINADLIFPSKTQDLTYDGRFSLDSFDIGKLIRDPNIGRLTIETKLSGRGLDLNNLTSNLNANIASFNYKGYEYRNIEIEGDVSDCIINGNLIVNDPNARFSFDGMVNFEESPFVFDFKSSIDTINFASLNLGMPDFGISGDLIANFTLPISEVNRGEILLLDFKANDYVHSFQEDTMKIVLSKNQNVSLVDLSTSFINAKIEGEYRILELPSAFTSLYNYYAFGDTIRLDSSYTHSKSKNIHALVHIKSLDFLQFYYPETQLGLRQADLDLNFDFDQHTIDGNLTFDSLVFDEIYIENAHLKSQNQRSGINLDINANNVNYGNIKLPIVVLNNYLDREALISNILVQDDDRLPKFKVGTKLYGIENGMQWKFNDSLVLNNSEWFIRESNEILITDRKLLIKDLVVYDKDEQMSITSIDTSGNDIAINFENFNISQFISLISMEESKVSGRLNGNIELRDLRKDLYFLANFALNDLVYNQKSVGSVEITADENPQSGLISGTFDLVGSQNDVLGRGSFDPDTRALNWDIYAGLLEMRLLDPFLDEFISNSEGVFFGEAHIGGTLDQPQASGEIILEDIATTIDVNNTRYNFENHLLTFDNQKIDIGSVEIFDELGNSAVVAGRIYHNYYSDLILDFQVETDKFLFLNTTKANNPIFYGKILLDAKVDVTGPPDLVEVQMYAKSLAGTSINLSPFSETESILKEEFIRYGKPGDFDDLTNIYLQKLGREYPFDVYLTLEANEVSEFTFVVDPLSGDKLSCYGNGNLQINLNPYGEQEIYGRYTVSDGSYSFSYGDFINKKFKLTPGGTINFNGNPFNATLDVKAVYTSYTTTYELIKNEVSLSESEAQLAQRRTKVNVILSLSGSLMEPEIKLDLEIPDLQSGTLIASIDRKLNELRNNQDELNNQVFGLLVFNSFILSESATTDFNSVSQDIALSSISNLISSQLNNLAQNVLRGVDVSIDVNSYNSQYLNEGAGGNITEVGLNVSKQLFNNRVKVSAGGNFNFDNSVNNQNQFSTFIGDFVVEYKLNEKGNYRIRVFSRSNYDQLLNQNTSKTGISLFFSKEFDSKIKDNQ